MSRLRWTRKAILLLKKLAINGYSASQIRDILNQKNLFDPPTTRNAICAKASYLKIKLYGNMNFLRKKRSRYKQKDYQESFEDVIEWQQENL